MEAQIITAVMQFGALGIMGAYFLWIQPKRDDRVLALMEKLADKHDDLKAEVAELRADLPKACQYLQLSRRDH